MSILSNIGAEQAAQELLQAIEGELAATDQAAVRAPLERLQAKAAAIVSTAKSGWY